MHRFCFLMGLVCFAVLAVNETVPMHEHPFVSVFLTDMHTRYTYPDGRTEERRWKAGESSWSPPGVKHASVNLRDQATELIQIELKARSEPKLHGSEWQGY
jgi:quercetin dioxygenase-like cupin family protein